MTRLSSVLMLLASFLLALALLSLALMLIGSSPDNVLLVMFRGAFGSWYGFSETLLRTVPVLLCALAAAIPSESGQINIGGEGQFHLGAIGATFMAALAVNLYAPLAMTLMFVTAICFGGAWAAIPAALKARLGVNEALVSLFLNYVAISLLQYLVQGPLRDPASLGWPMSPKLPPGLLLTTLGGTRLHSGIFLVTALAILITAFVYLTRVGTELRAVGLNPRVSSIVGIPVSRYLFASMMTGGALAGLAGYYEIASVQQRLRLDISIGFGYSGFLVAWICRGQLMLIIPVSILVAGLIVSSENLQITQGLPSASSDVAQGFLLLFVLLSRPLLAWYERRKAIQLVIKNS